MSLNGRTFHLVVPILVSLFYAGAMTDALADKASKWDHAPEYFKLLKNGEEGKALDLLNESIKKAPGSTSYRARAEVEISMHRDKEALADAIMACKLDPKDAESIRLRGRAYDITGNKVAALKDYCSAIQIQPKNHVFRTDRARLYESTGDYKSAIADYSNSMETTEKQNRSKLYEARGRCFMKVRDYQSAVTDFTAALTGSYGRSELLRLRSESYKRLGKPDLAGKDLQTAADMDDDFKPPEHLGNDH